MRQLVKAIKLLIMAMILLLSSSCALYHNYGPHYGRIVDAETKQPLEGAVVLAYYYTWLHASPGGPAVYFLDAQEAVTDNKGEFRIPSLNAFAFRPISTFESNPAFKIFKPRYKCYESGIPEDKYTTIRLRELKTNEERIENRCFPTSVAKRKMKRFIELQNTESVDLGFQPLPIGGD